MCRMLVFGGTCTRCGEYFTWSDLSQELSCLEAKNNGEFGQCKKGIDVEEHTFDQECDRCSEEDEGVGDVEEDDEAAEDVIEAQQGKRTADEYEETSAERKKQRI